jgi:hypothetical protein
MTRNFSLFAAICALALVAAACGGDGDEAAVDVVDDAEDTYSVADQPADATARFVSPQDGDTVSSPFLVELAAEGVSIVPADAPAVGEGHFHIVVDIGCVDDGEFLPGPSDEATAQGYLHFGDGSTERELELEPGTYELCLQLADGVHQAFGATDTITVTVE